MEKWMKAPRSRVFRAASHSNTRPSNMTVYKARAEPHQAPVPQPMQQRLLRRRFLDPGGDLARRARHGKADARRPKRSSPTSNTSSARQRVTGVRYVDAKTRQTTVNADLVFLCASAMASVQILMNSRDKATGRLHFDRSGTLAAATSWTISSASASGDGAGMEAVSNRPSPRRGSTSPASADVRRRVTVGFRRGYGYQGGARRDPAAPVGFGASMKQGMRRYAGAVLGMGAFGECLPYKDNRVLAPREQKVDRFGAPLMRFDVTFRDRKTS
ncbi:hypothetical protein AB5I41_11290 [Sphingomonas sp. MMS24-JH45]